MKILIIAAHPDDETLGCGGTMARHADDGDEVAVIFLTDGVSSRSGAGTEETIRRQGAMDQALGILGVRKHALLGLPDNALDSVPLLNITKGVEEFCDQWGMPSVVYTHHPGDLNIDHQLAHRATMTCFRPQPATGGQPNAILLFEVSSSTGWFGVSANQGFQPNYFRNISSTLQRKLDALCAYAEEMREWPHARSIKAVEHLACYRGAAVGLEAAEAFVVERMIVA